MVSSKKLTYWHNFMGPNYADHLSLRPAQRKNANVISMHETLRDWVSLSWCVSSACPSYALGSWQRE